MTTHRPENPLIVQGDHSVLVEVDSPRYKAARDGLARFAEAHHAIKGLFFGLIKPELLSKLNPTYE